MPDHSTKCPLCRQDALELTDFNKWPRTIECIRCGTFGVDERFVTTVPDLPPLPLLSGLARNRSEQGDRLLVTAENYEALLRLAPSTTMDRARALLRALVRMSMSGGALVTLNPQRDFPLAYCTNESELVFLLDSLSKLGWVTQSSRQYACVVTITGWSEAERLSPTESDRAFVAMWFADEMRAAYRDAIEPAIVSAGYKAIRVDNLEHVGKIDDLIIAEIRESRFVVADFT